MKNNLIGKYESRKLDAWLSSLEHWELGKNKYQANNLFYLVKKRKKTATSYLRDGSSLVKEGEYSVLENFSGKRRLLIQTTKVEILSFNKVDQKHAKKEGEGDLSLKYWINVHKEFFTDELKEKNLQFSEDLMIVLEEFKVIKKL